MGPKTVQNAAEQDLFRMELVNLIDQRHKWVKLAALIDWPAFEQAWGPKFESTTGRSPKPARQAFEAIVYVLRTGCQWKALPAKRFGSASAVHKRFLD